MQFLFFILTCKMNCIGLQLNDILMHMIYLVSSWSCVCVLFCWSVDLHRRVIPTTQPNISPRQTLELVWEFLMIIILKQFKEEDVFVSNVCILHTEIDWG